MFEGANPDFQLESGVYNNQFALGTLCLFFLPLEQQQISENQAPGSPAESGTAHNPRLTHTPRSADTPWKTVFIFKMNMNFDENYNSLSLFHPQVSERQDQKYSTHGS